MKRLPDRQILTALFMAALLPFLLVEIFHSTLYHVIEIKDYLLFHNIAEFFSVMVSLSIFGVGWFTYEHSRDRRTLFLSATFLAIGLMDFMHTLGYAGMPPFITPNSANKSTQYWIAVRSLAAAAFFVSAFIYPERPLRWLSKPLLLTMAVAIPLAVFTGVTFLPASMPATFIEGVGLTPFKKISEGVIILLLILASAAYWRRMAKTGERFLIYYLAAFILCILSELSFAVYRSAFDTYNLLGHLYKVAAFCLIYKGIFVASISSPFLRLSELNEKLRLEIGEREKADAELLKSEGRYRSLTLATSQIVWTTNAAGEVEEDIPLWRSFTGQGEDDVKGRGWMEALHPDDRKHTEEVWARAVETRSPYDTEHRIRRSDGEYRHFSVRGAPVPGDEGEIREWVGTCSDITDRKLTEALLERQLIVLNAINRVFHDAYSCDTLDLLGRRCLHIAEGLTQSRFGFILEINRQGRMDAIAMSDPGWIECRIEESEAVRMLKDMEVRGIWGEAVKRGVSVVVNDPAHHPDRVGTPAGHPPITCFLGVPLEQAGKVFGLIGLANKENGYDDEDRECIEALAAVFVEALMRKRAEVEIKSLNEELEERVAERTSQLEAANRELEAFAYSVSHDLRAPLRAIDGFSQALIEDCRERLDKSGQDYLRRVREASQRMGTLIDDILRLTRVSREELSKVPVDLSRLARAVAAELRYREPERDVEFVIDDGLETRGDPRLLKMALENLLGNAWKFTGKRPVARIEFRRGERDGRPFYIVRDDGAGFDMAYAEKLFTPFQRLHSQDEFAGSGIGLSLVQRIIHRHGGTVWAEGGVEKGATFYFTIAP